MTLLILANFLILAMLCTLSHSRIHHLDYDLAPQPQIPTTNPMNSIDDCWRSDANWGSNRFALADCAKGFGHDALGGKNGTLYKVTDPSDDPNHPKPGTLRCGAVQDGAVWITFETDMVITLKSELTMTSYKTIDGRGAMVEIANGPCIKMVDVQHVIIHGIRVHGCKPSNSVLLMKRASYKPEEDYRQDGDAITIANSSHIWIDHCSLASSDDGLVDITHASTNVTISNNYFTNHDKVMLLGHSAKNTADKVMKVTIVYNHFGPGLVQRMPRVRFGYAHVANNKYDGWEKYAIGGSSAPSILSEGNYFVAGKEKKQVTWREPNDHPTTQWQDWEWKSLKDVFLNKAYFVASGDQTIREPDYSASQWFRVVDGSITPLLTSDAGPLHCSLNQACY
ncbi:hypothetical protein V2J09_002852 [Rumex salicifolius]